MNFLTIKILRVYSSFRKRQEGTKANTASSLTTIFGVSGKFLFLRRDQQQRIRGGKRRKSVNLVALWETVTLFHTLLALEVCMWVTNKTGREEELPSQ